MKTILISACLLGCACRFDGRANFNEEINELRKSYKVVIVCPEVDGGLPIPRIPCEIVGEKVINKEGDDKTTNFRAGAEIALAQAKKYGATIAILKAKSPSCGSGKIYDGTFSSTLIDGDGYTTRLLKANGIKVYNELNYRELL
ncbi:MAG TPA: DUF523 domain-containing protein [Bacilli bacterium]|nr:DUF523 domain-containing protein [Bacilli bacterium]